MGSRKGPSASIGDEGMIQIDIFILLSFFEKIQDIQGKISKKSFLCFVVVFERRIYFWTVISR